MLGLAVLALVLEATAVVGAMLNIELPSVPSRSSRVAWSSVRSVGGAALKSKLYAVVIVGWGKLFEI